MLTIFTIAKPFTGHIGMIQNNALRSWLALKPKPEIILFGDDAGSAEAAGSYGIRHIPKVERNEYGTPLVDFLFKKAQEEAGNPVICYINADIILLNDFVPSISLVNFPSYVIIGRRWDLDVKEPVDFNSPDWDSGIRGRLKEEGKLHGPSGLDYFVFTRGVYKDVPPFAIGRTSWDNWLVYETRAQKIPLIDATKAITIIHQNHDYSHAAADSKKGIWKGPESRRNVEIMGDREHGFSIVNATHYLTSGGIKRPYDLRHIYYSLRAVPVLYPRLRFLLTPFKMFENLLARFGRART
jgi:hypothetical protein